MSLLSKLTLHEQITYRPPTDEMITQLEIETVNKLHFKRAEQRAEKEAVDTRFDLEVERILDLNATGSFWSMMQAADIHGELWHYLKMMNTAYSLIKLKKLWRTKLGFPRNFWENRDDQLTWYMEDEDYLSFFPEEDEDYLYFFPEEESDLEVIAEELCWLC